MPLFSVVIPLYNKADTIERTLRSVAMQTFRDFEVVIVDDGSTDNSVDIVERFEGVDHLRVMRQKNAGVSAARNRGVRESDGKYIAFIDADDEWSPNFLTEICGAIKIYPTAKVLGSGYERKSGRYIYSCRPRHGVYVCNLFMVWPYFQPLNSSSFVIAKDAFMSARGYREDLKFWEDGELWFRLAAEHKFYIVRKPLSRYNDDAQRKATGKCSSVARGLPHMDLLSQWICEGMATPEMKFCYKESRRVLSTKIYNNPMLWFYKRIRYYLWFSRRMCG